MLPVWLLTIYCVVIVVVSIAGGLIPHVFRLTHRRMQIALSFVAGVMLGVAVLHLLPHALMESARHAEVRGVDVEHLGAPGRDDDPAHAHDEDEEDHAHDEDGEAHAHDDSARAHDDHASGHAGHDHFGPVLWWLLAGFLVMFLLERFFCFHHHDPEEAGPDCEHGAHHLAWGGATIGLTVHTLIAGAALAASVSAERLLAPDLAWPGIATFLVIVLHKPFDSLTIGTLMAAGRHGARRRHLVNLVFALMVPLGAVGFLVGQSFVAGPPDGLLAAALAFSAGTFLCIAVADLIPELQFHSHDRVALTIALLLGLAIAGLAGHLEAGLH